MSIANSCIIPSCTDALQFFLGFATSEGLRGAEKTPEKKCYPGIFDPAGLYSSPDKEKYKLNEIKNGR